VEVTDVEERTADVDVGWPVEVVELIPEGDAEVSVVGGAVSVVLVVVMVSAPTGTAASD
jgi:hypothetical protein